MRQSKAMVDNESGGERFCEAQAIGVSWGRRWMGVSARPGRTAAKYSRTGMFIRRQVSTTERMAATLGPACSLPMWIQFLRPSATGRMEFSARLLLSSSSGYSRNRVSFLQSVSAYWQALLSALEGNATDCAASILLRTSSRRGWLFPDAEHGAR